MNSRKDFYQKPDPQLWTGRNEGERDYWHQIVRCVDLSKEQIDLEKLPEKKIALLGYCCDEGVARNQGRRGAAQGPDAIRAMLAKLPNHFSEDSVFIDAGNIQCVEQNLEAAHTVLSDWVTALLQQGFIPLLLGGGHDIAYAHFSGIARHLDASKTIGIINLDAHFDLRSDENGRNSGTPFYQIAQDCKSAKRLFKYFCLGIQRQSNTKTLFKTANDFGVQFLDNETFVIGNLENIQKKLDDFLAKVDYVYLTIDLDGFSSAYAPGVSAPSPFGFTPDIALQVIKLLCNSGKLISMDVVELNRNYDLDNCTAKLAARLIDAVCYHLYY